MAYKDLSPQKGVITIDPLAITLSAGYELKNVGGNKLIALKRFADFSMFARSIAAADSEFGWTWGNRGEISSADEDTSTANAANIVAAATASDWFSGPYTAARRYKTFTFGTESILASKVIVARFATNASTNYTGIGLQITEVGTNSNFLRYQIGLGASAEKIISYLSTAAQETAATSGQLAAGIWLRITLAGSDAILDYNLSTSATPPTSGWVRNRVVSFALDISKSYTIGIIQIVNATSSSLESDVLYYDDSGLAATLNEQANPAWGAQGYDTGNTAVKLIADFDLLDATTVVSNTQLQHALTGAINRLDGDAADWTFSAVRSSSLSAGASTYQAAGSTTVSGTGRYFSLYAKCASDGTEAGSIDSGMLIGYSIA